MSLPAIIVSSVLAAQLLCGSAVAAVQPSSHCPSRNQRAASKVEAKCYAMDHSGVERTFRLYVPAKHTQPLPIVLVLHGGGGDGAGMEKLTERGFNRIADRDGAIIVYPDGIGRGWNDGRTDMKTKAVAEQVDDLGYLRALLNEVATQFPVDVKRIYATGISNGGLMSYRLACDAADVFAAVSPVAANISVDLAPRCNPSRPVSILIMNGTDDPVMPWNGGPVKVLWMARGTVLSTQATVNRWIELNHCSALHKAGSVIDTHPDDGTSIIQHSAQCDRQTEVRLYEVQGGGHTWPDGEPYLGKWLVGRVSQELDASEAIWQFFRQHAHP